MSPLPRFTATPAGASRSSCSGGATGSRRSLPSFISESIEPADDGYATPAIGGEPPLPKRFYWRGEQLIVHELLRTWRSTRNDRGDTYLKRHWFEFALPDGRIAQVYFERQARRGTPRWWLYTISEESVSPDPDVRRGSP